MNAKERSLTVSLTVHDANAALEYYQKALDAIVVSKFEMPDGTIGHADLRIGKTLVYLSGEYAEWKAFSPITIGGSPNLLCIDEEDCDGLYNQAVEAGGEVISPMQDEPWGSRGGVFLDPFGYRWYIGKMIEKLSHDEIRERIESDVSPQD